jgi:hypothetical protein
MYLKFTNVVCNMYVYAHIEFMDIECIANVCSI